MCREVANRSFIMNLNLCVVSSQAIKKTSPEGHLPKVFFPDENLKKQQRELGKIYISFLRLCFAIFVLEIKYI